MYFISIIAIIAVTVFSSSSIPFYGLMNMPSLLLVLLLCIPILISSGLFKDFNNAFRIVFSKKGNSSLITIKRANEAVNMMIRTLLCGGLFLFLISLITILGHLDTPATLGPNIATAILCFLYSCGIALLLLPIKSILQVRMIEFMSEQENEPTQKETE